jgi:hypothetical protein
MASLENQASPMPEKNEAYDARGMHLGDIAQAQPRRVGYAAIGTECAFGASLVNRLPA